MKLARILNNEPFFSVLIERGNRTEMQAIGKNGELEPDQIEPDQIEQDELFDFSVIVPNTIRPDMPLSHLEYLPPLMQMLERDGLITRAQARLQNAPPDEYHAFRRAMRPEELIAPLNPVSIRCFDAFEAHATRRFQRLGQEIPADWYQEPCFFFVNTSEIYGPYSSLPFPASCSAPYSAPYSAPTPTLIPTNPVPEVANLKSPPELDFELMIGALVGKGGRDIPVTTADSHIAGFTICNLWRLRDLERREQLLGIGPGKSGDAGISIGPCIVTPDALVDRVVAHSAPSSVALPDRGRRYSLEMRASINGITCARGDLAEMHWTFAELISVASRNVGLRPGDLILSGCMGLGCLADINTPSNSSFSNNTLSKNRLSNEPKQNKNLPYLRVGDSVRLEVEAIGVLENKIVAPIV